MSRINDLLISNDIITVFQTRVTSFPLLTLKEKVLSSNMLNPNSRFLGQSYRDHLFIHEVEHISVLPQPDVEQLREIVYEKT
ncbi:MAG: hypothetical protein WBO24_10805 [Nitrospirales bacterium]